MSGFFVCYVLYITIINTDLSMRILYQREAREGEAYMILTKHAPHITSGEKHTPRAMKPLDAGFFAAMRGDGIHFGGLGADQAHSCLVEAVYAAAARAQVAVLQVGIGQGALFGGIDGGEELVAGNVVVEEVGGGDAEVAFWGISICTFRWGSQERRGVERAE